MTRIACCVFALLWAATAQAGAFSTAGWYVLEVTPALEIVSGPYTNEKACTKGRPANDDRGLHCVELAKAGDEVDRAIDIFGEMVKQDPHHADAMNIRGLLYQRKGDMAAAQREFENAMKASPDDYWPYVFRGDLFNAMGKRELAIADYEQVLARNPGDQTLVDVMKDKIRELKGAP